MAPAAVRQVNHSDHVMKPSEITIGTKIGRWTVVGRAPNNKYGHRMYSCRCECGTEANVAAGHLIHGKSKGCNSCRIRKGGGRRRMEIAPGTKFGMWTVVERVCTTPNSKFRCRCECGRERVHLGGNLIRGKTKRCKYHPQTIKRRSSYEDMVGQKFSKMTIIGVVPRTDKGKKTGSFVLCRCDCGREKLATLSNLKRGQVQSCGSGLCHPNRTHGHGHGSPEYRVHHGIITRCTNPNASGWADYGGRGITVCDRWRYGENGKSGFECFLEDMGPRPKEPNGKYMTIDRINYDGNYEPDNCKWATKKEQRINQRPKVFAVTLPTLRASSIPATYSATSTYKIKVS